MAVAATEAVAVGAHVDRNVSQQHCEDLDSKFWPQKETNSGDDGQSLPHMQNITDLNSSLKETTHDNFKLGQSDQESVHYSNWQKLPPFTSANFTNTFWNMSAITRPMQVNTLEYRFGSLCSKQSAYMKAPYLPGIALAR